MNDRLVRAANGEEMDRPPVWMMRQAGRHLPEYREIRAEHSFREIVETPSLAAEVTLQPYHRYKPDGVVIFSDILTVLEPLGFDYQVKDGVGPVIANPVTEPGEIPDQYRDVRETLAYVGDLLELLTERVGERVPLIGFAGGPFTIASYIVAGGTSRTHQPVRQFRAEHPDDFRELLAIITDVVIDHLSYQAEKGAAVVQLFDTYAGVLPASEYRDVLLPLHQRIFDELSVPTIHFVRNMGGRLELLADAGPDVVGLDWTIDIDAARATLGDMPVQGNLDPSLLFAPETVIRDRTREIIDAAGGRGHILNLGHGVHKDTTPAAVRAFVETAKSTSP